MKEQRQQQQQQQQRRRRRQAERENKDDGFSQCVKGGADWERRRETCLALWGEVYVEATHRLWLVGTREVPEVVGCSMGKRLAAWTAGMDVHAWTCTAVHDLCTVMFVYARASCVHATC